ncbi:MAG: hypothetical protein GX594_00490 [Pirellulaceae bacterium]|nr:hypothetical protein [Pirellulaceae bacterium]
MIRRHVFFAAIFTAVFTSCFGCGPSRPETAAVKGRVIYQGKPVAEGTITFYPESGRPATGSISADGTYRLTTFEPNDGATLGRHRVTIEARRITAPMMQGETAGEEVGAYGPPVVEWLVPEKYSRLDGSTLTAEVQQGGGDIDFDL